MALPAIQREGNGGAELQSGAVLEARDHQRSLSAAPAQGGDPSIPAKTTFTHWGLEEGGPC